jgi:hypothetical protein
VKPMTDSNAGRLFIDRSPLVYSRVKWERNKSSEDALKHTAVVVCLRD